MEEIKLIEKFVASKMLTHKQEFNGGRQKRNVPWTMTEFLRKISQDNQSRYDVLCSTFVKEMIDLKALFLLNEKHVDILELTEDEKHMFFKVRGQMKSEK